MNVDVRPINARASSSLSGAVTDIIAGTLGGLATVVVGHPLDTVKVRMQTSQLLYSSMSECISKTWRYEGIRGFYRGVQSPMTGEAFFNAVQFFAYGQSKKTIQKFRLKDSPGNKNYSMTVKDHFIAGGITGAASCAIECPVDLVKSQLQTSIHCVKPDYPPTFFNCIKFILNERGWRGLYQGLFPTFTRTIPSTAAYFGCYEGCKKVLKENSQQFHFDHHKITEPAIILISGGVGGFAYWLSTYPFDCIKSAMQSDSIIPSNREYKSFRDCVKKLYQEGGIKRFYRGLSPCLIRAFPANAACFGVYEWTKNIIER